MYQVNDLIMYSSEGVCRIVEISTPDISGIDRNKLYYVLQPIYRNGRIYIPIDTKVFIRPIISSGTANKLIEHIPYINTDILITHNLNLVEDYYKGLLQSHDCADLIKLIKTLYLKKKYTVDQGRKLGQVDEYYLFRAEDMLYGEFAIVLDMPKENIKTYIEKRVKEIRISENTEFE